MEITDRELSLLNENIIAETPKGFEEIYEKAKPFLKLMSYYKCAIMEVQTKFNVLDEEYSIELDRNPISSIKSRLKRPLSIQEKLVRKNLPLTIDSIEKNIHDVAGIRVICSTPSDVYALSDALLKQDDITLITIKDYIKNPKPNGYRSLHIIVGIPIFLANEKKLMHVEVQLRTIAMDCWASLEHQLRYKKNNNISEEISNELYECAEMSADLDLRMEALRNTIQPR